MSQADRHVPAYARALMARYDGDLAALREAAAAVRAGQAGAAPATTRAVAEFGPLAGVVEWLALLGLIV